MKLVEFKESLISIAKQKFPHAKLTIIERRNITIEVRVDISDKIFIEVYHNILSEKKSFALIMNGRRVFGYDNYKYWHMHPMNKVEMHIPCEAPVMEVVFEEIEQILNRYLKENKMEVFEANFSAKTEEDEPAMNVIGLGKSGKTSLAEKHDKYYIKHISGNKKIKDGS